MYPALYLYPLNDSFIPKHIALSNQQRVKIGRQTSAKTIPAERNGYFDSKVLSRQHAEVWEESGKIYIKDVKSSNGTFINGERLSQEGLESDPFELKNDDIVEFGIDIVGEDNKTIVHHKVAARVVCVFSDADAAAAARAEQSQQGHPSGLGGGLSNQAGPSGGGPGGSAFNFAGAPGQGGPGTQRRPALQPQGLGGMGGMGGSMRPPGKSGLTFDHIISRLQGELQKSRETGAELHNLTGAMSDIHDTLGGSLPPSLPPYPPNLPPVRPPQAPAPGSSENAPENANGSPSPSALTDLQAQIRETQSSLAGHVDKIRALEGVLAEHDAIKREVSSLRETIDERRRSSMSPPNSMELLAHPHSHDEHRRPDGHEEGHSEFEEGDGDETEHDDDDDDARSISTIVPHELERVDEEDEEAAALAEAAEDEDRRRRRDELGRPRTPEPSSMGMEDDDQEHRDAHRSGFTDIPLDRSTSPSAPSNKHHVVPEEMSNRLATLASQLETAIELSRTLQLQHAQAQDTITSLQAKVSALEGRVQTTEERIESHSEAVETLRTAAHAPAATSDVSAERESLSDMVNEWKKNVEGRWGGVQEAWDSERDRLRKASEEWERRAREMEASVQGAVVRLDAGLERMDAWAREHRTENGTNGDAKHGHPMGVGLVTPPSPRSLSSDSSRSRQRRRKARSASRGRASSRSEGSGSSGETTGASDVLADTSGSSEGASSLATSFSESPKRARMPWGPHDEEDDSDVPPAYRPDPAGAPKLDEKTRARSPQTYPLTPKASFDEQGIKGFASKAASAKASVEEIAPDAHLSHYSTAVGILMLSVAAAAVVYRVRPELST